MMMVAILNSAFLDSAILPKTLTQTNSIWLKHIYSDSTWWWQPSRILPCWIPSSLFSHLSFSSQTHSHLPWLVPTICTKKLHSFIGSHHLHEKSSPIDSDSNLMMAAILNSAILDSDSAMLDSETLFSSLRFTQKHSHSTLTPDSN